MYFNWLRLQFFYAFSVNIARRSAGERDRLMYLFVIFAEKVAVCADELVENEHLAHELLTHVSGLRRARRFWVY
jgi:hypothetical protein